MQDMFLKNPEQVLFIFLYFIALYIVLLKNRKIDLLTILVCAGCYYASPLILGKINILGLANDLSIISIVYYIFSYMLLLKIVAVVFFDSYNKDKILDCKARNLKLKANVLLACAIFFTTLSINEIGFHDYFLAKKSEIETGFYFFLSVWANLMLLSLSAYTKKMHGVFFSTIVLFSVLMIGVRSYFVFGFLTLWLILSLGSKTRLFFEMGKNLSIISIMMLLAIFKTVYHKVSFSNLEPFVKNIFNFEWKIILSQILADPMAVIYNLQVTIENNVCLDYPYALHRILRFFPLTSSFLSETFNQTFYKYSDILLNRYHESTWGVASSIFGETLAIFGMFGLIIFIPFWISLIVCYNYFLLNNKSFFIISFLPIFIYLSFYIHRVDMNFIQSILKPSFTILIASYFIYLLVTPYFKLNKID